MCLIIVIGYFCGNCSSGIGLVVDWSRFLVHLGRSRVFYGNFDKNYLNPLEKNRLIFIGHFGIFAPWWNPYDQTIFRLVNRMYLAPFQGVKNFRKVNNYPRDKRRRTKICSLKVCFGEQWAGGQERQLIKFGKVKVIVLL